MRDNKGVTLIELIIVMAIMAILSGFFVFSLSLVTGQEARECANNFSAALDKAKNYSLTKSGSSDAYMEVRKDADKGYIARFYVPAFPQEAGAVEGTTDYVMMDEQRLGKKTVEITCTLQNGTSFSLTGSNCIRIYYDRVSGAFKEATAVTGVGNVKNYCTKIQIKRGRTYVLTLVPPTGKHSLERTH